MREQPEKIDAKFVKGFIRRRKKVFMAVSSLLIVASLLLALFLPKMYTSTATILIEGQAAGELLKGISMGFIEERLQVITQQVLTRDRLTQILKKCQLLPAVASSETADAAVSNMRKNIELKTIRAGDFDRTAMTPIQTTVAFTLSYSSGDPDKAYAVAKELTSLYIEKNVERKEQITSQATAVLNEKLTKMQTQTNAIERRLAEFKRQHAGELPENMAFNLEQVYRLNTQLEEVNARIKSLEDIRSGAVAQPSASRSGSSGESGEQGDPWVRLSQLHAQLSNLQTRYSDKHPDVRKTKSEIQRLENQLGNSDLSEKERELEGLKKRQAESKGSAGSNDPEAAKLSDEIAMLSRQIEEKKAYQSRQKVKTPDEELRRQIQRRDDLHRKINEFTRKTQVSSMVQMEYSKLIQEYENSSKQYQETLAKLNDAKLAHEINEVQLGERFTVIEEPQIPLKPKKPDKIKIMLAGVFLALCAGLFASVVAENIDHTIKSPEQLQKLTKLPVLTVLPYVMTEEEKIREQSRLTAMKPLKNAARKLSDVFSRADTAQKI
jgi:polysaccharide chain length determinant protein (PEP-CTERM system associated)